MTTHIFIKYESLLSFSMERLFLFFLQRYADNYQFIDKKELTDAASDEFPSQLAVQLVHF
ncbi:hypothetical protein [Alkalibacterium sp.]